MDFQTKEEAKNHLCDHAEKLAFETGKSFEDCYTYLLKDKNDPAVMMLEDRNEPDEFTDYQNAEAELDRIAQTIMLKQDCSYIKAVNLAMQERPDLAEIYTEGSTN